MRKKKATVTTQPKESQNKNCITKQDYHPFWFVNSKQQKWINIPGATCRQIEKDLMDILNDYFFTGNSRIKNIFEKLGNKAGMLLLLLEQSPKEELYFDHIFVEMDIEELKDILDMNELQLKSAMLTLIEEGILKVDKTRNKGKYRIDHGNYQEIAYPCVLKGGNETIIVRSLHNA